MATSIDKITLSLFIAILFGLSAMQAQELTVQPKHPGQIVKFEIKFDGPDADKIKTVSGGLSFDGTKSHPLPNQLNFAQSFGADGTALAAPNTFLLAIPIPEQAATGDHFLTFSGAAKDRAGAASYRSGTDFQLPAIHIDNPRTFIAPHVAVHEQP